jgi:23S rRNA (adenine2503-C2)-methyltransferase
LTVNKDLGGTREDRKITNIVLMGSGEPLDNYDEVTKFLKLVNEKYCLNISQRNISLSTCGLPDKVKKLADDGFSVTLTISLHAQR